MQNPEIWAKQYFVDLSLNFQLTFAVSVFSTQRSAFYARKWRNVTYV